MFEEKIINTIKYLVYILIIAIPLVYFPTIMMPFQISKVVVFQSLTEIIFALWVGLVILNKKYRSKFNLLSAVFGIFIIIVSLSAIFGSDWRVSLWSDEQRSLGLAALFHFFALFFVVSSLKEKINWGKIWILSFWTAVAVSLIGISQKFIIFPKEASPWLHIIYPGIPDRIGSTFSNSAFMAGYLLFNFFIGLWLAGKKVSNRGLSISQKFHQNYIYVAGIILILIAIFLSQTLGVILGLAVGVLFLLFYFMFKAQSKLLRGASIAIFCLFIIWGGIFLFTRNNDLWQKIPGFNRIAGFSLKNESIYGRLVAWRVSYEAFKEKPVLGWGFENFRIAYNKHYDPKILTTSMQGSYWDKPHNIVLEYLTTAGILGLLAYLGIFIAAFYLISKNLTGFGVPIFIATLISYFVQNLFIFDTIGVYLMFFLVLGFIDSKIKKSENNLSFEQPENNLTVKNYAKAIIFGVLAISLIPVYYNYQIFKGANYEYWGVNYFLNQLRESSLVSFSQAMGTETPYIDDIRKNFANTVKQAHQQGMEYPKLANLQNELAGNLKLVINRHPNDFLNYLNLAEFYNIFYLYDKDYIKQADDLEGKSLSLSPERQQVYYVIAKTKLLENDINGAYGVFEKTVSLSSNAGDPHFFFGIMAYGLGDLKKGSEEIAIAKKLGRIPQKVEELINLGNFVGDLEHNYQKSIEYYKQALNIINGENNNNSSVRQQGVLLKLAIAYYFDHNFAESKKVFLELQKTIDLKILPIYENLKPVLLEIGINQ